MYNYPATLLCDFYKVSHREQYPQGTEVIYSTWIPRSNKYFPKADKVVAFGVQAFIKKYLIDYFDFNFFNRPRAEVLDEYKRVIKYTLNVDNPDASHIAELHDLGYLPVHIKAVKEGTLVPMRVPVLTIQNTHPKFFWVTNYLETLMSCELWLPSTSATIAYTYRKLLDEYAIKTTGSTAGVEYQGHDFSMRGMGSLESAKASGAGHLLSFFGTDTIPAILYHEEFYDANIETQVIGTSIPATEHSVMCSYGDANEFDLFKHLITEVYPSGFFSVVSDTWDFWKVITEYLPALKDEIMNRDGRVVIRPDSGDPVDIICGDPYETHGTPEYKGLIQCLWEIFGGTINEQGYKVLDPHIGAIYGDSITLERAEHILRILESKGFASTNIVFGIGSYTYQPNTRDTFGHAMKATYAVVTGEERMLFKDPKTDDGTKKSLRGMVAVLKTEDGLKVVDGLNARTYFEEFADEDQLETVYMGGKLIRKQSLKEIRSILHGQ
jgi:nicotinamide phosphoribosyltransferase